jgi:hypothetical protein
LTDKWIQFYSSLSNAERAFAEGIVFCLSRINKSKPKKTMAICIRRNEREFPGFRAFAYENGIPLAELMRRLIAAAQAFRYPCRRSDFRVQKWSGDRLSV